MNIENINQRQFDNTMSKEGINVTDYYDNTKSYQVFFRRNNRGTTPQGKLRLFYSQGAGISIGTIFVFKGENYLVISQDAQESNIYYTSVAMKCSVAFNVNYNGKWYQVPFVVASDRYSVTENNTISIINGSVIVYSGLNAIVESMEANNQYKNFGGTYEVKNHFYNNGLAYIYMTREANIPDKYALTYSGLTTLDINNGTYQLSHDAALNGIPVENPILTYISGNETIATVNDTGLITMVANGTVTITATWTEGKVSCDVSIIIAGEIVVPSNWTMNISGSAELKIGRNRVYTINTLNGDVAEYLSGVEYEITNQSVPIEFAIKTFDSAANTLTLNVNDDMMVDETFTIRAYQTEQKLEATFSVTIAGLY